MVVACPPLAIAEKSELVTPISRDSFCAEAEADDTRHNG
jgi:hypothetical protein